MSLLGLACKKNLVGIVEILVNIPGIDINNNKLFDNDTQDMDDIDDKSYRYTNNWNSPIRRTTDIKIMKLLLKHEDIHINEKNFEHVLKTENKELIEILFNNRNINIKGREIIDISYELPDELNLFPYLQKYYNYQDELALEKIKKLKFGKIKSETPNNKIKEIFGREYEVIPKKRYIDNLLILSAKYNNYFAIKQIYNKKIYNKDLSIINLQDESGKTALHWANINGNRTQIRFLNKKGADKSIQDDNGMIPSFYLKKRKFKCLRCGFITRSEANFIKHLNHKPICKPKLQDIAKYQIFEHYGLNKKPKVNMT